MMMNNPAIQIGENKVYSGHNLDILRTFDDNSIDSIVTDPPYELGFMGKGWDKSGIAYSVELWQECLRVLKPGGHLLAFGGSRTWHRLAVAIEDAGFEMRDSIAWLYGSGFPKSHNISKAIDKTQGADVKVGKAFKVAGEYGGRDLRDPETQGESRDEMRHSAVTDDAKKWDGWGTALKPAFEPIVVARKPLVGTVAENVLQFGVGGLNIDASRIGIDERVNQPAGNKADSNGVYKFSNAEIDAFNGTEATTVQGRWPANVILDETTAKLLDEQSGIRPGGQFPSKRGQAVNTSFASGQETVGGARSMGDSGGASRFFYVAKANKKDRNEGLDGLPTKTATELTGRKEGSKGLSGSLEHKNSMNPYANGGSVLPRQNFHPTVKPTTLMTYLIKLVTPEAGIVLDPFAGSGSTGKAAILEGYKFVGIELTEDYLPIIEGRLQHAYQTYLDKGDDLFA